MGVRKQTQALNEVRNGQCGIDVPSLDVPRPPSPSEWAILRYRQSHPHGANGREHEPQSEDVNHEIKGASVNYAVF